MNEQIAKFCEILNRFNKIHNLTNYKNLDSVIKDSLSGAKFITNDPKIAIDVGSGAGFPAIFLAMYFENCQWHLFEPNFKKSSFLTCVKLNLGLKNIAIHSKKIEKDIKFKADLITSRALMRADLLLKFCNGFFDENTLFILYKGSNAHNEIQNLKAKKIEIHQEKNRNLIILNGVKNG